jgi:hypothetical protein
MPHISAKPRLFPMRRKTKDPLVIVQHGFNLEAIVYNREVVKGQFFHVYPTTAEEISLLRLLDHRVDKFAPAEGEGVYVRTEALAKFD